MNNSPYKLLNELEKDCQNNYSSSILYMSKEILKEIGDEIKKNKNEKNI